MEIQHRNVSSSAQHDYDQDRNEAIQLQREISNLFKDPKTSCYNQARLLYHSHCLQLCTATSKNVNKMKIYTKASACGCIATSCFGILYNLKNLQATVTPFLFLVTAASQYIRVHYCINRCAKSCIKNATQALENINREMNQ
ncbi:MAG: hypothetical protein S4CHLAM20_06050 [Chlamydiia bacterium]|nr:hypothetical protein [Chlamydiia bacterium]